MAKKEAANSPERRNGGAGFHPYLETLYKDLTFPQERDALIHLAQENRIEPDIIKRMETMPQRAFNTLEEFRQAFTEDLENYGTVKEPLVEAEDTQPTSDSL